MKQAYEHLKKHIEGQLLNILCVDLDVGMYLDRAVERAKYASSFSSNKYYSSLQPFPNPFHSGQYCILLYFLSNEMFTQDKNWINAEKVYYLNKILNSVDIFYEVHMPDIFCLEHPLGSVMGRAKYGDYFFFYQGCTIGGSNGHYPTLGDGVIMYSNSKILGNCQVGNNVIMSANSYIIDTEVPDNSIVFGQGRDAVIKKIDLGKYQEMTKQLWKR